MTATHRIPRQWRDVFLSDATRTPSLPTRPAPAPGSRAVGAAEPPAQLFVVALCLAIGVLVRVPAYTPIDPRWWEMRFFLPLANAGLVVYLLHARRAPRGVCAFALGTIAACFAAAALLPERSIVAADAFERVSDSVALALGHVPLLLLGVAGVGFAGARLRLPEERLAFVRFGGELLLIVALLLIGGAIASAATLGLCTQLGIDLDEEFLANVVLPGVLLTPVAAAYVHDRNFAAGAGMARPFVRVFAPLVLLMAAIHLAATVVVGGAGFSDRDLLVQFHALLGLVVATLLLAVAVRRDDEAPSRTDLVGFGLAVVALAIGVLVLGAVAERIVVQGPTPKRWVAAGADVVILGQLAVLLRSFTRVWRGRAPMAAVREAVAGYLPIFVVWFAVVTFVMPVVVGFR